MLADMKIKPETIFPVQTSMQGASEVPIMVEGGVLVKIAATDTQTQAVISTCLYIQACEGPLFVSFRLHRSGTGTN